MNGDTELPCRKYGKESLLTLHNPCSIVHCLIMSAIIPIHINTPMKIKRLRTIYSIDKDSGFTSDFEHAHSISHHVWRLYYFDYKRITIYLMMSYRHIYLHQQLSLKNHFNKMSIVTHFVAVEVMFGSKKYYTFKCRDYRETQRCRDIIKYETG